MERGQKTGRKPDPADKEKGRLPDANGHSAAQYRTSRLGGALEESVYRVNGKSLPSQDGKRKEHSIRGRFDDGAGFACLGFSGWRIDRLAQRFFSNIGSSLNRLRCSFSLNRLRRSFSLNRLRRSLSLNRHRHSFSLNRHRHSFSLNRLQRSLSLNRHRHSFSRIGDSTGLSRINRRRHRRQYGLELFGQLIESGNRVFNFRLSFQRCHSVINCSPKVGNRRVEIVDKMRHR